MPDEEELTPEARLALERARFQYCAALYAREQEIKENLEKKAQFWLSFVTLFLGAVFLKLDFLDELRELAGQADVSAVWRLLVFGSVVVLALSLLASLLGILAAMRLQRYKHEYPDKLVSALFAPDSTYFPEKGEAGLLRATAMGFTVALEHNRDVNAAKARWTMVASYGVFVAVIALAAVLGSVAYLKLS